MNYRRNIAALLIAGLSGAAMLLACGDDDASPAADAGTDSPSTTPEGGADATTTGQVSGTVTYAGTETGYLELILFPSTDPTTFGPSAIMGVETIPTPKYPQPFTISDVKPGKYWIFCKINVGPDHPGPGPDDPSCSGAFNGTSWEREYPVEIVAGQTTTLAQPVVVTDPVREPADAGTDGGDGGDDAGLDAGLDGG